MAFLVNKFIQAKRNMLARRWGKADLAGDEEKKKQIDEKTEKFTKRANAYFNFQIKVEKLLRKNIGLKRNNLRIEDKPIVVKSRGKTLNVDGGIKVKNAASMELNTIETLLVLGAFAVVFPVAKIADGVDRIKENKKEKEIVEEVCKIISQAVDVISVKADAKIPESIAQKKSIYDIGSGVYLVYYKADKQDAFALIKDGKVIVNVFSHAGVTKIKQNVNKRQVEIRQARDRIKKQEALEALRDLQK